MSATKEQVNTRKAHRIVAARFLLWAWGILTCCGLTLGGAEAIHSSIRPSQPLLPVTTQAPDRSLPSQDDDTPRLDLNASTLDDLLALPGVGPVTAKAILAFRETVGPFRYPEELMDVRGIGEKTFARLRPLVTCGP